MEVILALAGFSAWINASSSADQFRILALFGINIVLHMLWSPLFFNLRRPDWALIEVPFLWLSIVALMVGLARMSSLSVWLLSPCLLWVTFAAFLNFTIVRITIVSTLLPLHPPSRIKEKEIKYKLVL